MSECRRQHNFEAVVVIFQYEVGEGVREGEGMVAPVKG
jgi:hypothetical protein